MRSQGKVTLNGLWPTNTDIKNKFLFMLKNLKIKLIKLFLWICCFVFIFWWMWMLWRYLASGIFPYYLLWHEWTIHHLTKLIITQNPNTQIQYINSYKQIWPLYTFDVQMTRKVIIRIRIWMEEIYTSQGIFRRRGKINLIWCVGSFNMKVAVSIWSARKVLFG